MPKKLLVFSLLLNTTIFFDLVNVCIKYDKEAVRLFSLAAQQGDSDAQFNLGWCYRNCVGVVKDAKEAARLFTLAGRHKFLV